MDFVYAPEAKAMLLHCMEGQGGIPLLGHYGTRVEVASEDDGWGQGWGGGVGVGAVREGTTGAVDRIHELQDLLLAEALTLGTLRSLSGGATSWTRETRERRGSGRGQDDHESGG